MKGNITEVRFDATYNLGNYQSEKIGLSYGMVDGDDVFLIIEELRAITKGQREIKVPVELSPTKKEEIGVKEKEEEKSEAMIQHEAATEKALSKPKKESKKTEVKKVEKLINVVYDRSSDVHKKRLAEFLDKKMPSWKTGPNLKKAAEISKELSGKEDFLSGDGQILDSFMDKFLAGF